jgi:two-component system phosphate regulon sensor histidine kinase PhoR
MKLLAMASCLAGAPVLALAVLAMAGWAAVGPALAAMAICAVVAGAFIFLWARELDVMTQAIRRVSYEEPPADVPTTILMETLSREIARLSRRLAARAALLEQHRRADTLILERLPDPVIVLAKDRAVRRANAAAREAFADDTPAVLRHPGVRGAIDKALASSERQTVDIGLPAPVQRDLMATVVPMDPPLADGGQILLVLSDRTRERLFERMRADFVANVSHELRTPLASLIGFTETLRGPAADDKPAQQRFLGIMAEQGARMNRLIDDLLSLSRIEMTEHQAPSERLDLRQLVPRLAAGFEPRLKEREARLDLRIDEDLPIVLADADQMAQVLQNLMDNAMKYGRDGGTVTVAVTLAEPGVRWPARPGVLIAVADEGSGIAKQHLPRLTERFYRVDKGRSRAVGGTGLGLAIVKHIVNRHRGQLIIESEEGKGTTVSVWLPATQPAMRLADAD